MESNPSPKLSSPEKTESAADTEAIADEMAASLPRLFFNAQPFFPRGNHHPVFPGRIHPQQQNNVETPNYMRPPNPRFMNSPTSHHNHYNYMRSPNPRGKDSNPYNHYSSPTMTHEQIIQNRAPQCHNTTTIYHNENSSSSHDQFWVPPPPPPPPLHGLIPGFSPPFMYEFLIYGGDAKGFSVPRKPNFSDMSMCQPNAFIPSPAHNFARPQWLYERPLPPIVPNVSPPPSIPETPLLLTEIRKQIEYYFSDNNLCSDEHLRLHMDSEGWVGIHVIARFKRIVAKTDSLDVIREALRLSDSVEIQDDRMRKRDGWSKWILRRGNQETKMTLSKAPSAETS